MRILSPRSAAARLPRAAAATLAASALAVGVLAAPLPAQAASTASPTGVVTEGPYCPDHPDVPLFGRWLGTSVRNGHHIDTYEVPYYWGYKIVDVQCD